MSKQVIQLAVALTALTIAVVVIYKQLNPPPDPYYNVNPASIQFHDTVQANAPEITTEKLDLTFLDRDGQPVKLSDHAGKNVVLVMTRGYAQARCPYCTAQTARLITNYDQFKERGAEVLVVYPGPQDKLAEFLVAVKAQASQSTVPFPMLFDPDLKAVNQLGIALHLAKPSTFILDKDGNLCFAYVGKDITDRPSVTAVLEQLDKLSAPAAP